MPVVAIDKYARSLQQGSPVELATRPRIGSAWGLPGVGCVASDIDVEDLAERLSEISRGPAQEDGGQGVVEGKFKAYSRPTPVIGV